MANFSNIKNQQRIINLAKYGKLPKKIISLKISKDNKLYNGNIFLEEKKNRECHLKVSFSNEIISIISNDFFDCLCKLKNEHPNILIYCKGYKKTFIHLE